MAMHLIRSEAQGVRTAWCGEKSRSDYAMTTKAERADLCSKCSSRYFASETKSFPFRLSDRLDLSADPRRYGYKSIYEIFDSANESVGFVAIKNGWGKAWEVRPWVCDEATFGQMKRGETEPVPRMSADGPGGIYSSKEAALHAVPALVEQGKLPSYNAVLAEARKTVIAFQVVVERMESKKIEQAEQIKMIREEFAGLLASGKLTNAQTTALMVAADRLKISLAGGARENRDAVDPDAFQACQA